MSDIAELCRDLAELLPALPAALLRDNTPSDGRTVLSAGAVVNTDVLHAMLTLAAEIPLARAVACGLTGEPCPPRPLVTCLTALPRLASRLHDLAQIAAEKRVITDVDRWTRLVKLALGLRTRDTTIGNPTLLCPLHPEPCELVCIGSEAFIRDDNSIYWQHSGEIWCAHCGATWPAGQWGHLGRILETA